MRLTQQERTSLTPPKLTLDPRLRGDDGKGVFRSMLQKREPWFGQVGDLGSAQTRKGSRTL